MASSNDQTINLSILLSAKDQISGVLSALKGSFSNFGDGIGGVNGQLDKLGKTGASTSDALKLVGGVVAGAVAVGIADIGVKSIKAASDFQSGMLVMQTSAGESAKNMNMVSKGVLDVATSVGMSAQQLVGPDGPLYQIESAGFHGADGLNLLKAAAQGARAEGANVTKVADALSSALLDYHLPASQAANVTSELVAAVGAGKANFEQFTGALHTVLPIASAMHVPLQDILGDMASMTQHGMSADQATQDLSHALQKLQQPTADMTSAMSSFGVTSSDLSKMLSDKGLSGTMNYLSDAVMTKLAGKTTTIINAFNGNKVMAQDVMKMYAAMPDTLQKVADAYSSGKMSVSDYRATIKGLPTDQANLIQQYVALANKSSGFNQILKSGKNPIMDYSQAMKAMGGDQTTFATALMISGENAGNTAKAIDAVSKAHADAKGNVQGFAEWQQTLNGQLEIAKAAIGNAGIALGTAFLPPLTAIIKGVSAILVPLATWVNEHQQLASVIGASIGAIAGVVAVTLTLSFALDKVKKAFGVLNVFSKGTSEVGKFGKVVDGVGKSAKDLSGVAEDTGKGIGGFIEGVLKPLGSTAVLKGAASAALIGAAIFLIAVGVNQASKSKIDIGNLAILMGATVVIGLIMALISTFAEYAIIGAIASAIIGGGLYLTALGISAASDASKNISISNLLNLSASLAIVSAVLALILPMAGYAAITSILTAVIGGGLVVAAEGLLLASNAASKINSKNLENLFDVIKKLSQLQAGGIVNDLKNLVKTAALSETARELEITSVSLANVRPVDESKFTIMQDILTKLGKLDAGSLFKDWSNAAGSTSMVTVAQNIVSISKDLGNVQPVDPGKLHSIEGMVNDLAHNTQTGDFVKTWMDAQGSGSLVGTAKNIIDIANNLSKVTPVEPKKLHDIEGMVNDAAHNIQTGNFVKTWMDQQGSGSLVGTTKNIVDIADNLSKVKLTDPKTLHNIEMMINDAASHINIDTVNSFVQAMGSGKLKDTFDNILKVSDDIAKIKAPPKNSMDTLQKISDFVSKAGSVKFNVTQVTAVDLNAMLNNGVNLAQKFVDGVSKLFDAATTAGHQLQSHLWQAVNSHAQDEFNQGHYLAQRVVDGINNQHGAADSAGHNIQGGMWNGIESHMQDEFYQGLNLAKKVIDGIYTQQGSWWKAGDDVAGGFAGGIRRNMWQVNNAVGELSGAAINKLKALLQIHSPSKVMDEIGQNVSLGMAQGIIGQSGAVARATGSIVPSIQLSGNVIRSGTSAYPNANISNATSGALNGGGSSPNVTLNVYVGAYAGQPGELNQLATTIYQQLQVIARQHGQATALPNIGIRPI